MPPGEESFIDLDDLSLPAELALHLAVLVLDDVVNHLADVPPVRSDGPFSQAGVDEGGLEGHSLGVAVRDEDEARDVVNVVLVEDGALSQGLASFTTVLAAGTGESVVLFELQLQVARVAKAAPVRDQAELHQRPVKLFGPAETLGGDFHRQQSQHD